MSQTSQQPNMTLTVPCFKVETDNFPAQTLRQVQ